MANFRYKAMTGAGTIIRGVLDAPSEAAVVQLLRRQGQFPLSASPAKTASFLDRVADALTKAGRPSLSSLRTITAELAALLEAGLELDRALGILGRLSDIGALKLPFENVRARVRDGSSFADALDNEPAFPKFYVSMVRAGEFGGTLARTMQRLADYLARTVAIREAVTSALIYPVILVAAAAVAIAVVLLFVLPEFKPMFEEAGQALPLPARIVMGIGDLARSIWWLVLLLAAGGIYWARGALKNPQNRLWLDRRLLKAPLVGRLVVAAGTERLSRTLGTLLINGVSLPTALALTKDVLSNRVLGNAIADAASSIREGDSLARYLSETHLFPDVTIDLMRIGEETGNLAPMLLKQADLDAQHLRDTVDRLLTLLVPALTILLGLVIAGIIASMLVAILSINDLATQ